MTLAVRTSAVRFALACALFLRVAAGAEPAGAEQGIPVTDPLVIAKCGSCHARDERGNMERVSWSRATPENWQSTLQQMSLVYGVALSPPEARSMVKYLSRNNGLAPEEAKPVMYDAERRIYEETSIPTENLRSACARCHAFARLLSWRRSAEDWSQFVTSHAAHYKIPLSSEAVEFLVKAAPLHTPEWERWSSRTGATNLVGRWLVTASTRGRGAYYGELQVTRIAHDEGNDEFDTRVKLTSVKDGSTLLRTGHTSIFGGYAWRGRSTGGKPTSAAPDDPASEAREVLWIAPDQATVEGRWFWGQYQEMGFDVKLRRASPGSTLLALDRVSLKTGSRGNRIRMFGDNFPAHVTPADLDFGPGVSVRGIVSNTAGEVVAEVDVEAGAPLGKRDVAVQRSVASSALAVYDRVDYVKVTPDSTVAAFGDPTHRMGYQQFDAIGYQRGADGKLHTADDVELGPVDVTWSMEVFYALEGSSTDFVGKVGATGFFTPASESPDNNFDVWVIATAKSETNKSGKPLVGKSYLVVTVPTYTFGGRQYVRDLDRWIDDGPAPSKTR